MRHCLYGRLFTLVFFISGCGNVGEPAYRQIEKHEAGGLEVRLPLQKASPEQIPVLNDDLEFAELQTAIERQINRFNKKDLSGSIFLGADKFSMQSVKKSLERLDQLLIIYFVCQARGKANCLTQFRNEVRSEFNFYRAAFNENEPEYGLEKPVLFTGYYTPELEVTEQPMGEFRHPIYAKPEDEWYRRLNRYEIDFRGGLDGLNLEMYYARDLFSLYLMQMEGGGKVTFVDRKGKRTSQYLSYAGSNSRRWRFLSTLLLNKGWIKDSTVLSQREFIDQNPKLWATIFSFCPSYVYFKETDHQPEGSDSVPLTDGRSIATDRRIFSFKGMPAFVTARRPQHKDTQETMDFSRFVLDQDTGGAIVGKARADFYFGEGEYAEHAANSVKARGQLFYLLLKSEVIPQK